MSIKLTGSTSGSIEVDVPAAVSGGDISLTLPNGVGSANQYLANGSTAGELAFVTPPGSFTSYAIICDEKAHNADGGTFTSGAWRTRDLNTEIADPDGIVSISSNQFTLSAGDYLIEASAPAYSVNQHVIRLQNITASTTVEHGQSAYADGSYAGFVRSILVARVSLTGNTAFEIQHRSSLTKATNGLGTQTTFTGTVSIYTVVKIYKEA